MFTIDVLHKFNYKGWYFKEATSQEILRIEDRIREKDKEEALVLTGCLTFHDCILALINTYRAPIYFLMYQDKVMGMGGIGEEGVVWLVLTKQEKTHTIGFLQFSKHFLPKLLERYECITNLVWTKNQKHVKYLNWLGAEWEPYAPDLSIFYIRRNRKER